MSVSENADVLAEMFSAAAVRSSAPAQPRRETRAATAVLSSTPRLLPAACSRKHRSVNGTGSTPIAGHHGALDQLKQTLAWFAEAAA